MSEGIFWVYLDEGKEYVSSNCGENKTILRMTDYYFNEYEVVIASDVSERDGIGIEIRKDNKILIEIFRDDTDKTYTVTTFQENLPLEFVEQAIILFKKEIPQEFID